MGIDGNEMADQLTTPGSFQPLIGPEPAFGTFAKVARGCNHGLDKQETQGAPAVH
jgi:hypothetical protein